MNLAFRLLPLAVACAVSACAVGPDTSYVASLSAPTDATVIASAISSFMRTQLPAASTTLVLDPTPTEQASNTLTPVLADSLRQQGFAVAQEAAPAGSHTLRYWVTPLDTSGELVRLMIDGRKEASRFFVRNTAGNLQAGGPFTVAQMDAAQ
jgi:hypothetical protein